MGFELRTSGANSLQTELPPPPPPPVPEQFLVLNQSTLELDLERMVGERKRNLSFDAIEQWSLILTFLSSFLPSKENPFFILIGIFLCVSRGFLPFITLS